MTDCVVHSLAKYWARQLHRHRKDGHGKTVTVSWYTNAIVYKEYLLKPAYFDKIEHTSFLAILFTVFCDIIEKLRENSFDYRAF